MAAVGVNGGERSLTFTLYTVGYGLYIVFLYNTTSITTLTAASH